MSPADGGSQGISQADIDAALAEAGVTGAAEAGAGPTSEQAGAGGEAAAGPASGAGGEPSPQGGASGSAPEGGAVAAGSEPSGTGGAADGLAEAAAADLAAESGPPAGTVPPGASPVDLPDLTARATSAPPVDANLKMLEDVELDVRIELGRARMTVEDVLRLASGAVVELDKLAGDPVDVFVNGQLVARGEVLVLNDTFCVRISEILDEGAFSPDQA